MPIFSPLVVVDEVVVVVVLVFLFLSIAVELLLFVVSVLPHPIKKTADRTAKIKKVRLNIGLTPSEISQRTLNCFRKGLKKLRYDTREAGIWQLNPIRGSRASCPPAGEALRLFGKDSPRSVFALRAQADRMSAIRQNPVPLIQKLIRLDDLTGYG